MWLAGAIVAGARITLRAGNGKEVEFFSAHTARQPRQSPRASTARPTVTRGSRNNNIAATLVDVALALKWISSRQACRVRGDGTVRGAIEIEP